MRALRRITFKSLKANHYLGFISLLTVVANLPSSGGEDIRNARENAFGNNPVDFWGGSSSYFYSHIPNLFIGWANVLLILQVGLAFVGLMHIANLINIDNSKRIRLPFLLIAYFTIVFSSFATRDGLMIGFLLVSIGFMFNTQQERNIRRKNSLFVFGLFFGLIGMSLRPWITPAYLVLVLLAWYFRFLVKSKTWLIVTSFALVPFTLVVPLALDFMANKTMGLHRSYPEQQVFAMDLAAAYCWSTNKTTVLNAKAGLEYLYANNAPQNICQSFRPASWLFLGRPPIDPPGYSNPPFTFLNEKNHLEYVQLRKHWLGTIVGDPASYIQNKYMYGAQLLLAGDTRGLRILNGTYLKNAQRNRYLNLYSGLFFIPWDIAITLHLMSFQISLMIWFWVFISRLRRNSKSNEFIFDISFLVFHFCWLGLSTIAYVADNGRFTYASGLLLLTSIFLSGRTSLKTYEV